MTIRMTVTSPPRAAKRTSFVLSVGRARSKTGDSRLTTWQTQVRLWAILLSSFAHLAIVITGARLHLAATAPTPSDRTIAIEFERSLPMVVEQEQPPIEFTLKPPPLDTPAGLPLEADLLESPALTTLPLDIPSVLAGAESYRPEISAALDATLFQPHESLGELTNLPTGGGLAGRTESARGPLVDRFGGTPQSERAVERALAWLAVHQLSDGSWNFHHHRGECRGRCRDEGSDRSTTAATALALLPFLGAGNTHQSGPYQEQVTQGVTYLLERGSLTSRGLDLQEGTMYGHGLATIVLCELLAMTHDDQLLDPASQSIRFITSNQHFRGGWRYFPGQPGDTLVTGWQRMALRSGELAGLSIPETTLVRTSSFFDHCSSRGGAEFGYQGREPHPTCTAVGLLCRMYEGWRRDDERLQRGAKMLVSLGPSRDDMYFNYYATQVLHHLHHEQWSDWNNTLRDHLTQSQASDGHELGSWYFADPHTTAGGRLCDTALATMILEVYYRHQPLYDVRAAASPE